VESAGRREILVRKNTCFRDYLFCFPAAFCCGDFCCRFSIGVILFGISGGGFQQVSF
jgi:hypothetical protein